MYMSTTPIKYVHIELLIKAGFNWDSPSLIEKRGGLTYTVYLSEPREGRQILLVCSDKREWYFRQIEDISEEEGMGLKEEEFNKIFEETINEKWKINPRSLKGRLERILLDRMLSSKRMI